LRRETQLTRALAGPAYVAIARARLERVQAVHDELLSLAPRTDLQGRPVAPDADSQLAHARRELKAAESHLQDGNFNEARMASEYVLKLTRVVMRAHWEHAASRFSSP